ncbi:unnamed protein product [Amoebophrya sp. A120]|nr:unnamed protein product [Amoebophrya sp. A120]|eukprot:GSA120T00012729001.1
MPDRASIMPEDEENNPVVVTASAEQGAGGLSQSEMAEQVTPEKPKDAGASTSAPPEDADQAPTPPRLYWLDWCRTQSVWNVVCGHVWWTISDETEFAQSQNETYRFADLGNNKIPKPGKVLTNKVTDRVWKNNVMFSNVYMTYTNNGSVALTESMARQRENSNMWEYVVEQGTLHTIPLFFLLSGYISAAVSGFKGRNTVAPVLDQYLDKTPDSTTGGAEFPKLEKYVEKLSSKVGEDAFHHFCARRFKRLILPFIFGSVCSVIPRSLMRDEFGALTVIESEMWFLYALWGFACANYAWGQYAHYYKALFEMDYVKAGQRCILGEVAAPASDAFKEQRGMVQKWCLIYGVVAQLVNWVIPVVANVVFNSDGMKTWWWLTLGVTCLITMVLQFFALFMLSGSQKGMHLLATQCVVLFSIVMFIPMTFVLAAPRLKEDAESDFLSVNMWFVMMLFEMLYMFGYFLALFQSHLSHVRRMLLPNHTFGVVILLLSAIWPVATFWGARSARRVGPFLTFYDDQQRLLGLLRSWLWMAVLAAFAYYFANGTVTPAVHKHITQSAMVVYVFHRFAEELWLRALLEKDSNRDEIAASTIVLVLLSCMGLYAILQSNWVTRLMFGLTKIA